MGFYIRKSVRVGMVRFNLSKSGVGVSTGIPGFRVGTGPRGAYVHVGRGGLYYRAHLGGGHTGRGPAIRPGFVPGPAPQDDGLTVISSAPADTIQDQSSDAILAEIRLRRKRPAFASPSAVLLAVLTIWLLSASNPLWVVMAIVAFPAIIAVRLGDDTRKTTALMYDLEEDATAAFAALHEAFEKLRQCARVWAVEASGATDDYKHNAGASQLLRRSDAKLAIGEPPGIKTNVPIPNMTLGKETLYFFPERVFVVGSAGFGAVSYPQLESRASTTRFIEDGSVPRDSRQVGSTWKFLNKNGSPDRRFSNNRQLPILSYGELFLASTTGLRAYLQTSDENAPSSFVNALSALRDLYQSSPERTGPVAIK